MARINSAADLNTRRVEHTAAAIADLDRPCVTICGGTGCRVYGSEKVWNAFRDEITRQGAQATLDFDVKVTGCHGFCEKGPLVVIRPQGIFYARVKVEDVPEIVTQTIIGGKTVERLLYTDPRSGQKIEYEHEVPFYKHQQRLILDLNGDLDPSQIDEYIARRAHQAKVDAALSRVVVEEAGMLERLKDA